MRFRKIYLEISNICNLNCSFCPKTKRKNKKMTIDEFKSILPKIRPYSDYLYFHLMGEPLCHPNLKDFLDIAYEFNFKVIITTNGTLLKKVEDILLSSKALHKINISLHSFEANEFNLSFDEYLDNCFKFGTKFNKIICYRLWNNGGKDELNNNIINKMKLFFSNEWINEKKGIRIGNLKYLEYGDKFDWPDSLLAEGDKNVFCYALRDQIGILADGTVVPCCLDHDGELPLGNIHNSTLEEIINSHKAKAIYDGFSNKIANEALCRKCGYAKRFIK